MRKGLLIILFLAFALNLALASAIECTIKAGCDVTETAVLRLSDTGAGGGHAGVIGSTQFPNYVCCKDLMGLQSTLTKQAGDKFMISLNGVDDAHASKIEGTYADDVYLRSTTEFDCDYAELSDPAKPCQGYDACLFSISDTSDAHITSCEPESTYYSQYCCRAGSAVCTIDYIGWGVIDEETSEISSPVEFAGMRQMVFPIVHGVNCEGMNVDFTIKEGGSDVNTSLKDIPLGTVPDYFGGGPLGDPNFGLSIWWTTDQISGLNEDGSYVVYAKVYDPAKPAETIISPDSSPLTVNSQCEAKDPFTYFIDDCTDLILPESCGTAPGSFPDPSCDGTTRCVDKDCDGIDDCIDQEIKTAVKADVDQCTGTVTGSSGCNAKLDCTNLAWGECFDCTTGDCADKFMLSGQQVMQRCTSCISDNNPPGCCKCNWIDGAKPPECNDAIANQWNKRFKRCMLEEDFPVFDSWNFVAVIVLLSGYYGIMLYRRRKK